MNEMSPLGKTLLNVLRIACFAAAALLLLFLGIELWQKVGSGFERQDVVFMIILAVMAAGALWMARAMGREMNHPGS
jgi:hypothetical protein